MNVTVRNVITSMRLISSFDWAEFFESVSLVDEVLRARSSFGDDGLRDPRPLPARHRGAGPRVRAGPRSRSRGRPRRWRTPQPSADDVEPSAAARRRRSRLLPDLRRPRRLRARAPRSGAAGGPAAARLCPGRHARLPRDARARHGARSSPSRSCCPATGGAARAGLLVVAILALVPASDLAIALVNRAVTTVLGPRRCRGSSLTTACRPSCGRWSSCRRSSPSEAEIEEQIERLEVHYLANRDGDLRFALLSDWLDAPTEHAPATTSCSPRRPRRSTGSTSATARPPGGGARFLLLPPPAPLERGRGRWMGWERKRGKLHELNGLLRGATTTGFLTTGRAASTPPRTSATSSRSTPTRGCRAAPSGAWSGRWPIRSTARLRRCEPAASPRATPSSSRASRRRSRPSTRHRSSSASSPAPPGSIPTPPPSPTSTRTCFGEGSYTGKGIYDVDAFERGARRPGPRERAAQPRPVRGRSSPGPGWSPTSSSSRVPRRTT